MTRNPKIIKLNLDHDTNPKFIVPKPILKNRIPAVPELCLTPDSKPARCKKPPPIISSTLDCENLKPDPALELTPEKCQRHRKDSTSHKSLQQYEHYNLNTRKSLVHLLRDGFSEVNTVPPKTDVARATSHEKKPLASDPTSTLSFWFSEPTKQQEYIVQDHIMGKNISNVPKQIRKRESRRAPKKVTFKSRNVVHDIATKITSVSNLRKPEFNSTLKLARDMMKLKMTDHHLEEIKKIDNEKLQQQILEKAVKKVNIPFEEKLYKDLISLDVKPVPETRAKYQVPVKEKDPEPDVMDMFSETFYTEVCSQEVNFELPFINEPTKSSEDAAFVQYRLIRKWEGLPLN